MWRQVSAALVALCGLALAIQPAFASAAKRDFYGVVSQGSLEPSDFDAMRHGNVATLRFPIHWDQVEPEPGRYEWSQVDAVVAGAAGARVELLPFTYGAPGWLTDTPRSPLDTKHERAAWAGFHRALVERYGPRGNYWAGEPEKEPIRRWQPGNEPNLRYYWGGKPSPHKYARLLERAATAIRAEDPTAKVVMAGLAPGRGELPWKYLRDLYHERGIDRHFDAVAFHPYARGMPEIRYLLDKVRAAMRRAGDAETPLEVTELSWGSGGPRGYPLVRSPKGQARMLRKGFRTLHRGRHRWRIRGVDWFSWEDGATADTACLWCEHAGLFTLDRRPKPAWRAFKRFTTR